jgi:hypothetical protein
VCSEAAINWQRYAEPLITLSSNSTLAVPVVSAVAQSFLIIAYSSLTRDKMGHLVGTDYA